MKKLLIVAFMLVGFGFSGQAQDISKNALGLRLGSNNGFGGELSYQRGLSKNNRLELDLGFRDSDYFTAIKVTGVYQWVWNIDKGFNWYAGVGGGVGTWSYNDNYKKFNPFFNNNDGGAYFYVAGDIGIEYNFDAPILISLDYRPEFNISNGYGNNYGSDIAFAIRYQF